MEGMRYGAQPMTRNELRQMAKDLRKLLCLENARYINVVHLIENVLPLLYRRYKLSVEVLPTQAMGKNHALTNPRSGQICIREDVYDGACRGLGRDRFTIIHELAHFLLHDGIAIGLARVGIDEVIPAYCDPEWQANAFAGEFLMDHDIIRNMTVEEVATQCGVSLQAARFQKSK